MFQLNVKLTLKFCLTDINPDFYKKLNQFSRLDQQEVLQKIFKYYFWISKNFKIENFIEGLDIKLGKIGSAVLSIIRFKL